MKLTAKSRYALRALVELAKQPPGENMSLLEIARRQRIKPAYLEQVLFRLRRAKLIKGKKGPRGGFFLARDPEEIKLKHVLNAMGESTAPLPCVESKPDKYCSGIIPCEVQDCWRELKKQIDLFFNEHTLHDVCGAEKRNV